MRARREQQARDFVAAMTAPDTARQLARWDRQVCPAVIGIAPEQAEAMERRMGEVAASVDLRVGKSPCTTTLLVIVDNDANGVVARLVKTFPITLRTDGADRLRRFARSRQPVRWISVTDPCGFGGCTLPNSHIRRAERPAFAAMLVVVDGRRLTGFDLAELSDYVAFVALANPRLGAAEPTTSVMAMFERDRPVGALWQLTGDDMAYLHGLYRMQTDGSGQSQRSGIAARMVKTEK